MPGVEDVDTLMDANAATKTLRVDGDPLFAVRAAYQTPLVVTAPGTAEPKRPIPIRSRDALAFENLALFSALDGDRSGA